MESCLMQRANLVTAFVASVVSAAVTSLVIMALVPAAVDAQVARTVAPGLTVVREDGLPGLTADVRPTGGGVLRVLGVDGTTSRLTVGAAGVAPGQPPNPANVGVDLFSEDGATRIGRIGTLPDVPSSPIGVALWDAQGHVRYRATLDAESNPTIQLFDAHGTVIWSAP
jgi:hypothetical protein